MAFQFYLFDFERFCYGKVIRMSDFFEENGLIVSRVRGPVGKVRRQLVDLPVPGLEFGTGARVPHNARHLKT